MKEEGTEHGDGEDEVEYDDFDEDGPDGFFGGFRDGVDHDAGQVGDGFDAGEGEDDADEVGPLLLHGAGHGFDGMPADGEVGDGEGDEDEGEDEGRHGDDGAKVPACIWDRCN